MNQFLSKYSFWVVQLLGIGAMVLAMFVIGGVEGDTFEKFMFCLGIFLAYFIPTTLLRYLYKGFVNTNPFKVIDVFKILFFLTIAVLLGKELPYYLGAGLGMLAEAFDIEKGELTTNFKAPKINSFFAYVGPLIIYGGWTFFYFIIKQFLRYRVTRMSRLALKDEIKQAQLNTLKGHLNPQFMISSLQQIKELMSVDVPQSRRLLTQLSEILRYSLTKNNINAVALKEESEVVNNYLALLNLDAFEKYEVECDLAAETMTYEVPPMLLTSLMEMATKHGILQLEKGGEALLTSRAIDEGLEIKLVHSGKMMRSKQTALIEKTIKQRLKLLFEEKAKFTTIHELNKTTLLVTMPLNEL